MFSSATNYPVGTNPVCVAAADIDGSGQTDIVVGSFSGNLISALLNTDGGLFGVMTNTSITNGIGYPVSLAAADFNHDNVMDLAVARDFPPAGLGPLTVLLGRGDGSFAWGTNYGSGNYYSVVVGDLNHDNEPDIVVGSNNGRVSVFLGNGDGSFAGPTNYHPGSTTIGWAVALGDFNADNNLDIVVSSFWEKKVFVLTGAGDGTFQITTNYALTSNPEQVVTADANSDGKLDIITVNTSSNSFSVLLGNGDGTFQLLVNYGLGAASQNLTTGDFNGDGFLDLVTANYLTTNVSILLGNGDGTFALATNLPVSSEFRPQSVAVADFDGDGKPDIVAACFQNDPHGVPRQGVASVFHNDTLPALKIKTTNDWLELKWPAWLDYNLECSSNLSVTKSWLPVTNISFLSGSQNILTNYPVSRNFFYRLRK